MDDEKRTRACQVTVEVTLLRHHGSFPPALGNWPLSAGRRAALPPGNSNLEAYAKLPVKMIKQVCDLW